MKRILFLVALATAVSCISPHGVEMADVNPRGWRPDEKVTVTFTPPDTRTKYDVRLWVSFDRPAGGRDVGFDIRTLTPDSLQTEEMTGLYLNVPQGTTKDRLEAWVQYRTRVRFKVPGEYTFRITHRSGAPVKGIRAVGLEFKENI